MHSSNAVAAVIVAVVFALLPSVAIGLRFYAQNLRNNDIHADDYFIVASGVVSLAACALTVYAAVDAGLGWPLQDIQKQVGLRFEKSVLAGQILWATAITLVKVALLLFYRRIFITQGFRKANNAMLGITGSLFLTFFIGTLYLATLCMPLFVIRSLNMSTKKKVMVAGVFWLGSFCVVASIIRLYYFVWLHRIAETDRQFSDVTFHAYVWSIIQPSTSIVAACLPTYGPLFSEESGLKTRIRRAMSMISLHSWINTKSSGSSKL